MTEQPIRQFRIMAFAGGAISFVGSVVVVVSVLLVMESGKSSLFVEPFAAAAIIGLIISTIALTFAWKSDRAFWDCPTAYVAAGIGVTLPSLLVVARFLVILQKMVTA